jgi:hypothetical protein
VTHVVDRMEQLYGDVIARFRRGGGPR